jgi:hypothetical protein
MFRQVVPALGVWLLIILVLGACGREADARKIPETPSLTEARHIPAGNYVTDEFRPAMSLRLDEGWRTGPAPDFSYGVFMEKYNSLTLSPQQVLRVVSSLLSGVPGRPEGLQGRKPI